MNMSFYGLKSVDKPVDYVDRAYVLLCIITLRMYMSNHFKIEPGRKELL